MQKQAPRDNTAMRWGPRLDGDLRKPRIAKCTNEEEIMNLMASVRWEHIRMGLMEAGIAKREALLPAIAYLAKHGWNDNLKALLTTRNEQFKDMGARMVLEKMEEQGKIGRSTMTLLIPAGIMAEIRGSGDPVKTAQDWRERLEAYEDAERAVVRKRAMEALGEIKTKAALMELAKLLEYGSENINMWADSILSRAARESPEEVLPILKGLVGELEKSGNWKASSELFWIFERLGGRG